MKRVGAMILAGGEGKRMGILCRQTPKPALPFAGRFRVIDFSLSNCLNSQIKNMFVLTDYLRSNIANYLRSWSSTNALPNRFDLSILEPRSGHYRGTADAIYQNLEYLQQNQIETLIVLAADHIYRMDYRELLTLHEQKQADVTIGVLPVPLDEARRFGTIKVNAEDKITEFAEKADSPLSNLVSMGIYAFNIAALTKNLKEDSAEPGSLHDFGYSIIPSMVKQDRAYAFRFNGYWQDIGTPSAYYEASMNFLHAESYLDWPTFTAGKEKSNTLKSFSNDRARNSLISPGCIIKGYVENSILSPGVIVEEQAIVKNSILMNNVFIASQSQVESCIIGERANISRYCHIGGPGHFLSLPKEITVLGEDMMVPPNSIISNSRFIRQDKPSMEFAGGISKSPSSAAVASYQ